MKRSNWISISKKTDKQKTPKHLKLTAYTRINFKWTSDLHVKHGIRVLDKTQDKIFRI